MLVACCFGPWGRWSIQFSRQSSEKIVALAGTQLQSSAARAKICISAAGPMDQWMMLKSSHCLTQRCSWNTVFSHNMSQLSIFIVKFSYVDIHTHIYIWYIHIYTYTYIYDIWLHTGLTCVSRQRVLPRFGWLTYVSQLRDLNSQREWCEQCFQPPLVDSSGIILHTYIIIYIYIWISMY